LILEVEDLKKYYPIKSGLLLRHTGDVKALDGVSFTLERGKTLGIVGESGCGKSTLGKAIIRLYEPTSGIVKFEGQDFLNLKGVDLRNSRRDIQMIFQDPFASLDPRMTVANILNEPLEIHQIGTPSERKEKVDQLMRIVGLKREHLNRYPHEFSGGQRQRISIARCLALNPKLIVADEPVSALDVSIQAQVLNLLKKIQKDFNISFVFISHDLSVVEHMCDEVAVMYLGKIVEKAPRDELFNNPAHPYTKALLKAIPIAGRGKRENRELLSGDVPSPIDPPSGCAFHPRCPKGQPSCSIETPKLENYQNNPQHQLSCPPVHSEKSI
jgi:oligopeptide transport system ATP-binding protein